MTLTYILYWKCKMESGDKCLAAATVTDFVNAKSKEAILRSACKEIQDSCSATTTLELPTSWQKNLDQSLAPATTAPPKNDRLFFCSDSYSCCCCCFSLPFRMKNASLSASLPINGIISNCWIFFWPHILRPRPCFR
jgi:hypothetical protein